MGDTLITVIAIFLAAILMFVLFETGVSVLYSFPTT